MYHLGSDNIEELFCHFLHQESPHILRNWSCCVRFCTLAATKPGCEHEAGHVIEIQCRKAKPVSYQRYGHLWSSLSATSVWRLWQSGLVDLEVAVLGSVPWEFPDIGFVVNVMNKSTFHISSHISWPPSASCAYSVVLRWNLMEALHAVRVCHLHLTELSCHWQNCICQLEVLFCSLLR